jgi:hypothetical protein
MEMVGNRSAAGKKNLLKECQAVIREMSEKLDRCGE